jgi:hypothetical protein
MMTSIGGTATDKHKYHVALSFGETTGELYLWSIIIGTLDSLPKIQARFGCELLKDKEAEDFLAAVAASDNLVYRAYVRSRH